LRDPANRGRPQAHTAGILCANARGEAQHPSDHAPRKAFSGPPPAGPGTGDIQHADPVSFHEAQNFLGGRFFRHHRRIDDEVRASGISG
jgi:hypothetical protein